MSNAHGGRADRLDRVRGLVFVAVGRVELVGVWTGKIGCKGVRVGSCAGMGSLAGGRRGW